jgi:hypothetical protein
LPKKGIRSQSTGLETDDVSDGRDAPHPGADVEVEIRHQGLCHAHDGLAGAVFADHDIGFMVADDKYPRAVKMEVEKHP